jgi:glucan phosphoethanolaminetransferase (alkaline phosphatase superfamily)
MECRFYQQSTGYDCSSNFNQEYATNLSLITKLFDGSSISIIGLNLIIVTLLLLFFLFKTKGFEKEKRNYWVLGILGFVIMLFSFVIIYIYNIVGQSIQAKNYLLATMLSFAIANPYPLLPYLAYNLFDSMIGLMIYKKRKKLIKKVIIPIGLFFFIYGLVGCMNFPKTISKADYF